MNIAIALTAARMGAAVANHTDVVSLIKHKDKDGKEVVKGANLKDMITGKLFEIRMWVAQWIENRAHDPKVVGLSPTVANALCS